MKTLVTLGFVMATTLLTACNTTNATQAPTVGIANPASEFCVKQGGTSEIRKSADGSEYGVCRFANGTVVEEWDYFRKNSK